MKKAVGMILSLLVSLSNSVLAYDGWSGSSKVKSVRVYGSELVLVVLENTANPGNCSDKTYLQLNMGSAASDRRYSALLTAYASGKNVNIALTGCSYGGDQGIPLIEQVWLV